MNDEKMMNMKVRIQELNPDPDNTRVHDQRNIDLIIKSLKRFDQYRPFVVQKKGMIIRIGNGMFEAMKQIGWYDENIEVNIMLTDIDDEKATALSIVDNRTSDLSYFNDDMLRTLIRKLDKEFIDLTGFSEDELKKYFIEDMDFDSILGEAEPKVHLKEFPLFYNHSRKEATNPFLLKQGKKYLKPSFCFSLHKFLQIILHIEDYKSAIKEKPIQKYHQNNAKTFSRPHRHPVRQYQNF